MALVLRGTLLLLLPHLALPAYLDRRFIVYNQQYLPWSDAREKCQSFHDDLAVFRNASEYEAARSRFFCDDCWIGIQKSDQNWVWTDGEELTFYVAESDMNDGSKRCAIPKQGKLDEKPCHEWRSYLCYEDDMVLVTENKTWEEALDHCREHDPSLPNPVPSTFYDLPPVHDPEFLHVARRRAEEALSPTVWVGLRFMAGEWLWLDGHRHAPQPTTCPAERNQCGALERGGDVVTHQRCVQKRNFLCYRRFY